MLAVLLQALPPILGEQNFFCVDLLDINRTI